MSEQTMARDDGPLMRPEQAEVFARGLYYLADIDGIDDREVELIRAFLDEVGRPDLLGKLPTGSFDPTDAAEFLETSFLRRVFLRTAIVLIRADGKVTDEEREAIAAIAFAFGLEPALAELMSEAEGLVID